jgi:phospholipase C
MSVRQVASSAVRGLRMGMASLALFQLIAGTTLNAQTGDDNTTTPIKHVIVIIGENRSFDHVFAT